MLGRHIAAALAATTILGATPAAAAILIGATHIEITSAGPDWMQIAEFEAIEFGTLDNVAAASAGGAAAATSSGFGTAPLGAIDGNASQGFGPHTWHSGSPGAGETLFITLGQTANLTRLVLYGTLHCCTERNNYQYKVFNAASDVLATGSLDARAQGFAVADFAPVQGGIPEPATWAMMIMGFGAAGVALRSRRRVQLA
jgi:hypothetical protein